MHQNNPISVCVMKDLCVTAVEVWLIHLYDSILSKDVVNQLAGLNRTKMCVMCTLINSKCDAWQRNFSKSYQVAIIGPSAVDQFSLWSCCRLNDRNLPFAPKLCVALAPVGDLAEGYRCRLSDDGRVVEIYMKGSPIERKSYDDDASPSCQLPVCCELLLVSGERIRSFLMHILLDSIKLFLLVLQVTRFTSCLCPMTIISQSPTHQADLGLRFVIIFVFVY